MEANFPRTLSLLRKEKGLSQKEVARNLGISQALLSHYENGVREPGLAFVVAAADFYGVSADFLLGRTMSRDGTEINIDELYDDTETKQNKLARGGATALMAKKLAVNSLGVLFDIAGRSDDRELCRELYSSIMFTIYKLFRTLYRRCGAEPEKFFSIADRDADDAADAAQKLSEMRFRRSAADCSALPPLSHDTLSRDYPLLFQSLLSLTLSAEKEIGELTKQSK